MKHPIVRTIAHACAYALFWSWNVVFLAFMFLGFAPTLLPELINAVLTRTIPAQFLALGAILVIIPLAAAVLGLTVLRGSPGRLLTLGYGIEGPLMLIVAVRFFAVREATPVMALLLVIAVLGLAAFLWQVLDLCAGERRLFWEYLRVTGLTLLLIMGLYASVWIAFYAIPIPIMVWRAIIDLFSQGIWQVLSDLREMGVWWIFLGVQGLVLAGYTATLFVVMPIAVPILYVRTWWRGVRRFAARGGWLRAAALTVAAMLLCAASVVLAGRQPQQRAFALLETPPASSEEAQVLLEQREAIRAGLLNAYLAPARYVSAVGEVYHVRMLFMEAFDLSEKAAEPIQRAYEVVARPVLYEPVEPFEPPTASWRWDNRAFREEPAEAAELYEAFFDEQIVDGEREAVVRAARSTWSPAQAQAAWQAVDDREIHLVRQEVNVTHHGDWAEVELYEVYQNQTAQRQEVVYYFSLPESAVVTGVWLGNSADRDGRFTYRVSPRGAAQAMYRSQVRYNLDPALVEQIGPRQYRLRVFPIEPQRIRWNDTRTRTTIEEGPEMHMWLTYRVLADGDTWPLPRLADKRNVYWDGASVRLMNGERMQVDGEAWLPLSVPAAAPVEPVAHRFDFPGGQTVLASPVSTADLTGLPGDVRLAVVLDRSRSMAAYEADVEDALARLAQVAGADVDLYLTASAYRGEGSSRARLSDVASGDILYYGGQNAAEMLAQFEQLRAGDDYDAVLILTDGTGYGLGSDIDVPLPDAPVWMVHLDGAFPLGYDDATLEAIQASGGGVAASVDEALARLAVSLEADDVLPYDVVDGYVWQVVPTEAAEEIEVSDDFGNGKDGGFDAFAARRLILAEVYRNRGSLDQLETLDDLHAIAIEHSVVTPYSSMIVLITPQQEQRLDQLEREGDRFEREHEDVGETLPETGITAVPEPEEWLLLVVVAGMLLWYARKRWPDLLRRRAV
jgi:putative PEP-CTERM system integral membrane protein